MGGKKKIRVIVADDHGIMREGLKVLIEKCDDIEVVGEARTGQQVLALFKREAVDVVLTDIKMPCGDGIEVSREILRIDPCARILVFSSGVSKHTIERIVHAGISGFVMKESVFSELADAIRSVHNGERYFCQRSRTILMNSYTNSVQSETSGPSELSPTEHEIIRLLSEGKPIKRIAIDMCRSPKTIDARRRAIMQKLKIASTAELTKFAIRKGLTTVD